jgi:hypothetical protein
MDEPNRQNGALGELPEDIQRCAPGGRAGWAIAEAACHNAVS